MDSVDAEAGRSFYLLEINASNSAATAWRFNPALLQVVSNRSFAYPPSQEYNETSLLGAANITAKGSVVGIVAFDLPNAEHPSQLRYSDASAGLNLEAPSVPEPAAVASRLSYNVRLTVNGQPVAAGGWTLTTANSTSSWEISIIANGVVENNSLVFFTGQTIKVSLWFEYLKKPADPGSIVLKSVANDDGLQAVGPAPDLPIVMMGWGSQSGVVVLLKVPEGQLPGSLSFSAQFSTGP